MRLSVEFTIEPFLEGNPGPHVIAGIEAARASGASVEVGPFGTTAVGEREVMLNAIESLCRDATAAGAKRISLQVSLVDEVVDGR